MGSRGPGRMLQTQYLGSLERANEKIPAEFRGESNKNPQGAYPMRPNATMQTCGVSSVGRRDAFIGPGMYDVKSLLGDDRDFVADFKDIDAAVRARDGEFLIGVWGTESGLGLTVSADASTLDPELMGAWQERLSELFREMGDSERKERGGASL
jgi:hypothetical protein